MSANVVAGARLWTQLLAGGPGCQCWDAGRAHSGESEICARSTQRCRPAAAYTAVLHGRAPQSAGTSSASKTGTHAVRPLALACADAMPCVSCLHILVHRCAEWLLSHLFHQRHRRGLVLHWCTAYPPATPSERRRYAYCRMDHCGAVLRPVPQRAEQPCVRVQIRLARPGVVDAVLRLTCGGRELCDGGSAACISGVVLCLVHHVDPRDKGTVLQEPEAVHYSDLDTLPPDWVRHWTNLHSSVRHPSVLLLVR